MALLESDTTPLGTAAPEFDLPATDGERYSLDSFDDAEVLVMMFICNHCPYVKAVRQRLIDLANQCPDSVAFVAVCSNDAERYPDDGMDRMKEVAEKYDYPFPYLRDESQQVARAFGAVCTPDFFVYDSDRKLAYRGRLDDAPQEPDNVQSHDLIEAIEALLAGGRPDADQKPSMGCSIKWKQTG